MLIFKKGKVNNMGEMMNFPETPEEFVKQYSFRDKKKEYTNGSELIPVFRVEQMIDHYFRERRRSNISRRQGMTGTVKE